MNNIIKNLKKFWKNKFDNDKNIRKYIVRFLSKIDFEKEERVKGLGPCWIFKSKGTKKQYGRMLFNRKTICSHRISFRLFRGKIPKGLLVCHQCDIRKCCNPKHLFLGTYKENTRDMISKGRNIDSKRII